MNYYFTNDTKYWTNAPFLSSDYNLFTYLFFM